MEPDLFTSSFGESCAQACSSQEEHPQGESLLSKIRMCLSGTPQSATGQGTLHAVTDSDIKETFMASAQHKN